MFFIQKDKFLCLIFYVNEVIYNIIIIYFTLLLVPSTMAKMSYDIEIRFLFKYSTILNVK
jgi:hypothetical protein